MLRKNRFCFQSGLKCLHKLTEQEIKRSVKMNGQLIHAVKQRMLPLEFSYLLLLTDPHGMVLYSSGTEEVIEKVREYELCTGTSFALEHAGLNAISASKELRRPVILKGEDHSLEILKGWSCCCVPILGEQGVIAGFLDISTDKAFNCELLIQLLEYISSLVEQDLRDMSDDELDVDKLFEPFQLTAREKEVMRYWFLDYDYKQIGLLLKMSPGTVKVNVINVYNKMNVNSKASFILKVLGII
ncbi:hypothetical protein YSY43_41240 [Paenibacillus sp. YSY-4.3]